MLVGVFEQQVLGNVVVVIVAAAAVVDGSA